MIVMRQLAGIGEDTDGPTTDKLFWFPSDIKAMVSRTDTEISTLADDFKRSAAEYGAINYDTLAAFNTFYNEWREFADNLGWWAKMAASTVAECQVFRQRASQWRDVLIQAGANPVTQPFKNLPPPPGKGSPWAAAVKWAAVAGIVLGGVYAVSKVAPLVKGLAGPALRTNPRRRRRRKRR